MTLPESLPARLYLLAYDTEKNRVTAQSRLGLVLRAAALADLYLAGRVTDENGKVRPSGDRWPTGDPLLDEMLQQLAGHRPRSWQGWIAHGKPAIRTVRTQLEDGRCIRVEHRMILPD
ncbi:MAG: GPP34 family phosphoprotein, partial [Streptosporangiaceae bacterium]|nr:GPP34 family phosphoprotein [Streptosporangiaceae bacterium]